MQHLPTVAAAMATMTVAVAQLVGALTEWRRASADLEDQAEEEPGHVEPALSPR